MTFHCPAAVGFVESFQITAPYSFFLCRLGVEEMLRVLFERLPATLGTKIISFPVNGRNYSFWAGNNRHAANRVDDCFFSFCGYFHRVTSMLFFQNVTDEIATAMPLSGISA